MTTPKRVVIPVFPRWLFIWMYCVFRWTLCSAACTQWRILRFPTLPWTDITVHCPKKGARIIFDGNNMLTKQKKITIMIIFHLVAKKIQCPEWPRWPGKNGEEDGGLPKSIGWRTPHANGSESRLSTWRSANYVNSCRPYRPIKNCRKLKYWDSRFAI